MNILEIVSGAEVNGAVIHCLLLTRSLARRGHRVTLLCRPNAFIAEQLKNDNVEIHTSDMHRWPLDELKRVAALCRTNRINIAHTHMTRAHNFGVCLRHFSHVPCVATAHSHIVQPHWMFNDHVISVSEATRRFQRSRNFVRPARIETVHGFMDYPRSANVAPDARARIRQELNLDDDAPLIGLIGDIIARKGQMYMVRALPRILAAAPKTRLAIVGEPKRGTAYFLSVKAEAERLGVNGNILWLGHRNDIPELMAALDVYVLASLDEMFPVAVLEAMAASRAIVATRVGGVPECVQDKETAVMIPSRDSDALAEAILALVSDPARGRAMGERARAVAQSQFSVDSQTPRIEAVFERVIERASRHAAAKR